MLLDTNRDGVFNDTDMVDAADTSLLASWFQSHTTLGRHPGLRGYRDRISEHPALEAELSLADGIVKRTYDTATSGMSVVQYCETTLTRDNFNARVVPEAQVGFIVLNETEYQLDRAHRALRQSAVQRHKL